MANLKTEYKNRVTDAAHPTNADDAAQNLADVIENADVTCQKFAANGTTPAGKQSITGASTQDQVDSIVAALVALGLATDNR